MGLRGPSGPFPCCWPPLGAFITPPALRMVHDGVSLENVVKRIRKPFCQYIATTRTVHTGGLVQFTQQRLQLDLPKGTHVRSLGRDRTPSCLRVTRWFVA
jgi:hypothetical protein